MVPTNPPPKRNVPVQLFTYSYDARCLKYSNMSFTMVFSLSLPSPVLLSSFSPPPQLLYISSFYDGLTFWAFWCCLVAIMLLALTPEFVIRRDAMSSSLFWVLSHIKSLLTSQKQVTILPVFFKSPSYLSSQEIDCEFSFFLQAISCQLLSPIA